MDKDKIIETVCEVCGIEPEQLKHRSRKEPLPVARALIAHFLHEELRMMPRDIQPLIGHPDYGRTSIYVYFPKGRTLVKDRSPFQKELREKTEQIQKKINELKK